MDKRATYSSENIVVFLSEVFVQHSPTPTLNEAPPLGCNRRILFI